MRKILAWITVSSVVTGILIMKEGFSFDKVSPAYIEKTGTYPYVVLGMCIFMLYLKRSHIVDSMEMEIRKSHVILGISLAIISMLLPANEPPIQILAILLLWVGIFTAMFGRAALIPIVLVGIYSFALLFPLILSGSGDIFPMVTTIVLVSLIQPFIPLGNQDQTIHFLDIAGGNQYYFIDAGCSGSASLAIFFSLFFLMMLDTPIKWRNTVYMLIFGIAGTSLQNIMRLVVLVFAGYWYGNDALWTAHAYAGYILFPVWFTFFAYVYLKQAKRS